MKTKKLFLIAAMLLASMCTFAQSESNEPLKGDVNGDGKVDVADITAIVAIIMNNTSQTTYYWYVGLTQPTISTDPSQNTTTNNSDANKWHIIGTSLGTYSAANPLYKGSLTTITLDENYDDVDFYICIPTQLSIYDGLGNDIADTQTFTLMQSDIVIAGVHYRIYKQHNSEFMFNIY